MLYKRYKMLQKYINGEAQEEYKQGELISDVTFGTLSECNEGNQKPDESIEGNIYQWVTISNDYVCNGKDKYTKEKEQSSSDGGKTWIDTGRTRQGGLIEANSTDCVEHTVEYRWVVVDGHYICVGYNKYEQLKKQESIDGGEWTDVLPLKTMKGNLIEANSADCGYVPPTPGDCENQYLTFDIVTPGTIVWKTESPLNVKKISYSINNGEWTEIKSSTSGASFTVSVGDKVRFKGNNTAYGAIDTGSNTFNGSTASFNVQGNIMSLTNGDSFASATTISDYTFVSLFTNTSIINAKNLILPATTLTSHCYDSMFKGCTKLTTAPVLSATTLAEYCYSSMFYGCTSLETAPTLPATKLERNCYYFMFEGCTNLVNAPELPATTLARECYYAMFEGCTSLVTAPTLPAITLANSCYNNMFRGCTKLNYIKAMFVTKPGTDYTYDWVRGVASTGTFVKNSEATWNFTGNDGIPGGWTVIKE